MILPVITEISQNENEKTVALHLPYTYHKISALIPTYQYWPTPRGSRKRQCLA